MDILVEHEMKIRVRYSETDQMGVVYYGNYAQYYEVGRVEFLRSLGFVYKELEDQGVIMPVVHYSNDYRFPAKYDEELTIKTSIKKMPSSTITFEYVVFNPEGRIVADAVVILVFLNKDTFRPVKSPDVIRNLLLEHNKLA